MAARGIALLSGATFDGGFTRSVATTRALAQAPLAAASWAPSEAQVIKQYRHRQYGRGATLRGVRHPAGDRAVLDGPVAGRSTPPFVERLNLDIRRRGAAVGRRVNTLCQGEDGLLDQLVGVPDVP